MLNPNKRLLLRGDRMDKKTKIISLVLIVVILFISISVVYIFFIKPEEPSEEKCEFPDIGFTMDKENRTLTVTNVDSCNGAIYWEDIAIDNTFVDGDEDPIVPSGIIKKGDVIENCRGITILFWVNPTTGEEAPPRSFTFDVT
jgi:hypothetical protein